MCLHTCTRVVCGDVQLNQCVSICALRANSKLVKYVVFLKCVTSQAELSQTLVYSKVDGCISFRGFLDVN